MGYLKKEGALNMVNRVLGKSPLPQAVPIPPELIIGETGFAKAAAGNFFSNPKNILGKAGEKLAKNKILSKIKAKAAAKKNEKFMNQSEADMKEYVKKQFKKIDVKNQPSSTPSTPAGVSNNEPNYESPPPEIPEGMGDQSVNQWHKNKREWTDIGVSGIPGVPSIRKQK